jgi:hypothetical protein
MELLCDINTVIGAVVAQLVEALHYNPAGHGFDSRWCQWTFPLA